MHNQNITVTKLGNSYRVEQLGQSGLTFAALKGGGEILRALAEAFWQGEAWLGSHKSSAAHKVDAASSDDPRYVEIERWGKFNRQTKTSWYELWITRAVGQSRHRLVFCVADEDLALDVWSSLGDEIDVSDVQ